MVKVSKQLKKKPPDISGGKTKKTGVALKTTEYTLTAMKKPALFSGCPFFLFFS